MPIYNTECTKCGKVQEILTLSMSEELPKCKAIKLPDSLIDASHERFGDEEVCDGDLRKLPTVFGKQSAQWSKWSVPQ